MRSPAFARSVASVATATLLVGCAGQATPNGGPAAPPVEQETGASWVRYEDPAYSWTVSFPASWHLQRVDHIHWGSEEHGVLISNVPFDFEHPSPPRGSVSSWDMRRLPADAAVLSFGWFPAGAIGGCADLPDTSFPLSLTDAKPVRDHELDVEIEPRLFLPANVAGTRYYLNVFLAPGVPPADRRVVEKIVASITPATRSPCTGQASLPSPG